MLRMLVLTSVVVSEAVVEWAVVSGMVVRGLHSLPVRRITSTLKVKLQ